MAGAPIGNQNAVKGKRWQKALERQLARMGDGDMDRGLDKVAGYVVKAAVDGDKDAWKEIGDRIDGKAVQETQLGGIEGGAPIVMAEAPRPRMAPDEWLKAHGVDLGAIANGVGPATGAANKRPVS